MRKIFIIGLGLIFAYMTNPAYLRADSDCNEKQKSACTSDSSCSWVDSYKRKDGTEVSSYCRSKGNHDGDSSKAKKKDSDKKDSKSKKEDSDKKDSKSKKKDSDKKDSKSKKKDTDKKDSKSKKKDSDKKDSKSKKKDSDKNKN